MEKELEDSIFKFSIRSVIISIVILALGIGIINNPETILITIIKILGGVSIIYGIWHCYKFAKQEKAEQVFSLNLVMGVCACNVR